MSFHLDRIARPYPIWFLATLGALAALVLWPYLDQGWLPLDDGIYGWYAQRMADGAVLRRDLLISQPGYVAYLNALTWQWLGQDLLALRYPILVLTALMAIFGALLLPIRDPASALAIVVIMVGLGFPQFSVPSPSWYCLALALAFAWLLASAEEKPWRFLLAGMAAGVCVGTRQLSGGLLIIAGLCTLAQYEIPASSRANNHVVRWLGIGALALTGTLLPTYLYFSHSLTALYWGLPAVAVLIAAITSLVRGAPSFPTAATCFFMVGCLGGFAPLVLVNVANGELGSFLYQITVGASGYVAYGDDRNQSFGLMLQDALELLTVDPDARTVASSVFLLMLLATPLPLSWAVWKTVRRAKPLDPVLACACLFSVSSTYFQSYLYLFYAMPLTVIALTREWSGQRLSGQRVAVGLASCVALFTLLSFGGKVSGEVLGRLYRGTQAEQVECDLPRCPLEVAPAMRERLDSELAELRQVPADRPLLILPSGAPYYLMLSNPTPWRWASLNPAALSDHEQALLLDQLKTLPETVVAIPHEPVAGRPVPTDLMRTLCPSGLVDGSIFGFYQLCDVTAHADRAIIDGGLRNPQPAQHRGAP